MGASLLVFKNKSDVTGAMSVEDVRKVKLRDSSHGPADTNKHIVRVSNWTAYKRIHGTSSLAAPLPAKV